MPTISRSTKFALIFLGVVAATCGRPLPRLHNLAPTGDLAAEFVLANHRVPGLPPILARHTVMQNPRGAWESRFRISGVRTSAVLVPGNVVAWRRLDGQELVFKLGASNALVRRATLTDEGALRITAADGWTSAYQNGELESLETPGGTVFTARAQGACLHELRDPERGPIYTARFSDDGVLRSFVLEGALTELEFDPSSERLLHVVRDQIRILTIAYQDRLCRRIELHDAEPLILSWRKRGPFELLPVGYILQSDGAYEYSIRAMPSGVELSATASASRARERLFVPRHGEIR